MAALTISLRNEALRMLHEEGAILETAREVTRILREAGQPGVVVGGVAVMLHGHVRTTVDVNVLVDPPLEPLAELLISHGFEHEADARRFLDAMRARFEEFALSLHPEKTRLIEFGRHAATRRAQRGLGKPETFNFLGFTMICGKSRQGRFLLKRRTRRDRMRVKLQEIKGELRRRMHQPIPDQGQWLRQVVTGFFAYHAVPTNFPALQAFRLHTIRLWRRVLRRRRSRGCDTRHQSKPRRTHL